VTLLFSVTACSQSPTTEPRAEPSGPTILERVRSACLPVVGEALERTQDAAGIAASDFMQLGPNRLSLTVTSPREKKDLAATTVPAVECVLTESGAPAHVTRQLSDLNALSGSHVASWKQIRLTWSWTKEAGVSAILRDR
jgi:hypothetical protein